MVNIIYAAHINNDNKIQTVDEHSYNTAKLCKEYCSSLGGRNIGKLQGLLHDAGKLTPKFNSYIRGDPSIRRGEIDHSYAGAKYMDEISDNGSKAVAWFIARTIISHHGLHDWVDNNCNDYFKDRIAKDEDYESVKTNIPAIINEKIIQDLLSKSSEEYMGLKNKIKNVAKKNKIEYAFYLGMLERIFQSALIDADRTDTARFMNGDHTSFEINTENLWKDMHNRLEETLKSFEGMNDPISIWRRSISQRCLEFAKNDVKVCRLVVPTGGGKTLSSMRFAINYCIKNNMNRIIYVAPFMSILEQNSDEIRKVAEDKFFIEHHSNALLNFELNGESNEYKEYELHTERWDSPVIATTMVQFLNTLFSDKISSVRRMHHLSKAVIIIDEVQSIPPKCVNLFNLAVNFLTNICGAVVILCSATQPVNEGTLYPMLIDKNFSMTGDYSKDFEITKRVNVIPKIDPRGYSYDKAARFCSEKFAETGNILIIVNTKSAAFNLYERIKKRVNSNIDIIYLSTNMCPQHRKEKIQFMHNLLNQDKPVICIATQLIEAGVNISFRCVIRSISGLDNIAQAAGRCNRHGEAGKVCPVYIIKLKEEKLGSLPEITIAQEITQQMIDSEKYSDLLAPNTISDFFRRLYAQEKKQLLYNVCSPEGNVS